MNIFLINLYDQTSNMNKLLGEICEMTLKVEALLIVIKYYRAELQSKIDAFYKRSEVNYEQFKVNNEQSGIIYCVEEFDFEDGAKRLGVIMSKRSEAIALVNLIIKKLNDFHVLSMGYTYDMRLRPYDDGKKYLLPTPPQNARFSVIHSQQ